MEEIKKWEAILNDFTNCGKRKCEDCKAHTKIQNEEFTYCGLLCGYKRILESRILETLNNS